MNDQHAINRLAAAHVFWRFAFGVLMLNFIVWTVIMVRLGGSALGGKEEDGRFYLRNRKGHKEVSERVYRYSQVHTYATVAGGAILLLAMVRANGARARLFELTGR